MPIFAVRVAIPSSNDRTAVALADSSPMMTSKNVTRDDSGEANHRQAPTRIYVRRLLGIALWEPDWGSWPTQLSMLCEITRQVGADGPHPPHPPVDHRGMRRHPDRAAPTGTTWKGIPASPVAIVALVAVPTVVVAAALGLLAAPRFGTAWAVAAGVGYVLLAAAVAPLVLRLDEVRVRRPSRRFVQGFEDAAIGMAILSRDLTLVRVNDTFCELLGRPMEDLVGHRILEFTHPDDLVPSVAKRNRSSRATTPRSASATCARTARSWTPCSHPPSSTRATPSRTSSRSSRM